MSACSTLECEWGAKVVPKPFCQMSSVDWLDDELVGAGTGSRCTV